MERASCSMDKFIGSSEWLKERRKGIGASDCSAVMGINPWRTPYQVYLEKTGAVKDWSGNPQATWGLLMEPALRQYYSNETGRAVRLPDKIMYNSKYPYMLASLDGFTDDGRIVELKTARSGNGWGEPGTNQIPDYYALQVHHQMIVTGFETADVVVSIGGGAPELYEVPADPELQEMIIEAEAAFWERVKSGNPPDPVTYSDAVARFGKSSAEGAVIASEMDLPVVDELRSVRDEIKRLGAVEDELRGKLIIALGEAGDMLVDTEGHVIITYKLTKGVRRFDAKALEKEMPDIYQKYLTTGEPARRFLIR